jgi:protein-S-isoprenylcysteine O-methyltransferase Ste14
LNALELRIPPPLVVAVIASVMLVVSWQLPAFGFSLPYGRAAALALFVSGLGFGLAAVRDLRAAGTTINPAHPCRASAMVTWGVYRFSRNPMYLALLVALVGWAVFLSNLLSFLLLPVFKAYMNRFQIAPEERALRQRFGSEFEAYTRSAPKWL